MRIRRTEDGVLHLDLNGTEILSASGDTSFSGGQAGLIGIDGIASQGWGLDNFDSGNITSDDPAINPTGTDVTAYPGQSRTAVMQNVVATPNAIAYVYNGTIVSTHTDFVWTAGSGGAGTITYTVAQGNLPYGNTDLVIRVSFDSGDPVTLAGMALTVEDGFQVIEAAGTLVTETTESIWSGYTGDTPVAGYQTHTPTETSDARTITVNADGTWEAGAGDGSSPDGYSFPVRVWDGATWSSYTVTINLAGEDTDPDAFTFTAVTNATVSTEYESNSITVAGVTEGVDVDISIVGGEYAIDTGGGFAAYTSDAGTVQLGDIVKVKLISSGSNSTAATATLTIGDGSAAYVVTTEFGIGIVSVNAGEPVVAGEEFVVVLSGINANDVTAIALQNGSDYYACPVVEVTNSTTLTAAAPGSLPTGLSLTAKAFQSKHAALVRELISGIPANLVTIAAAVEDAEAAKTAAEAAQAAAEIAAETAGASAYEVAVMEGFVGDEAAWLLSLKGDTGDTGAAGATGPQGDPGTSISILGTVATTGDLPGGATEGDAYVVAADGHLWVWSGSAWVDAGLIVGPEGKSAYQVAVANGFVGTEAEWLESLKAPLGFVTDDVRTFTSADQVSNNIAVTLDCSAHNYFMLNFNGSPTPSALGAFNITLENIPTEANQGCTFHIEAQRGGRKPALNFILPEGITADWPAIPSYGALSGEWDLIQGYWTPSMPDKLRMSIVDGRRA